MAEDLMQLSVRSQYGLSFRKFDSTDFTANKLAAAPGAISSESRESYRSFGEDGNSGLWRGKAPQSDSASTSLLRWLQADPRENDSLCHSLGQSFRETTSSRDAFRSHDQRFSSNLFTLHDNLGVTWGSPLGTSTHRYDFRWPGKQRTRRGR
eukprot:s5526_g5.t1